VSGVKRATRVAGRVQEELSAAVRGLSDPRVAGVLVSRAEVTDDLQSAKVYVRRDLGGGPAEQKALLKGLEAASGRLRRELAQALKLRYAPTLRFYYDEAPDAVQRIEELLREVKRDSEGEGEP
jgi:ribosome-binding factor A